MITTQNPETRFSFRILWARTFGSWPAGPSPLVVTCEEFLGNPDEEIGDEGIPALGKNFTLPEVDPDEFERVFQWFQS